MMQSIMDVMKYILTTILVFFFVAAEAQVSATDFKKLYWLEGTWTQTNLKTPGRTSTESWSKKDDALLIGRNILLQGRDTLSVEKATLLIKDGAIYYVADVPQNKAAVYFKLIALSETAFVCENKMHDFPKKISYTLLGNILKATVSGNGKSIDYIFKKL